MKIKPLNLVKHLKNPEHRGLIMSTMALIFEQELQYKTNSIQATNQDIVSKYLISQLTDYEHEVFSVMYLDNQHNLIEFKKEFTGTVNQAQVYPRIIVKRALELNASAVILAHNHPSGSLKASDSDKRITKSLVDVLKVIDVRVLDHMIVSKAGTHSMAQHGEL
jgi:DNA repair protein RadC